MKFYEAINVQENELNRLREREADLVSLAVAYLERARRAEALLAVADKAAVAAQGIIGRLTMRLGELEARQKNRVEMTGAGGEVFEILDDGPQVVR
jgi:Zn-dependent protease with chaperone function